MKTKVLVFGLLWTITITAQTTTKPIHYLDLWGKSGYSLMLSNLDNLNYIGGYGVGIGFGYKLELKNFLFNTGLEFDWLTSADNIHNFTLSRSMLSPYESMAYNYRLSEYKETSNAGFLTIPLLFGGQFKRYYFMAGANVGLNVIGNYKTKTNLSVSATDKEFIDELKDMPNHYLKSVELTHKNDLAFQQNISLSAEFGLDLDEWLAVKPKPRRRGQRPRKKTFKESLHYRVGVFAEYGLLNINNYKKNNVNDGQLLAFTAESTDAKIGSSRYGTGNAIVNPLFIGAKFAIEYEIPRKIKKPAPKPMPKPRPQTKKPTPKPIVTETLLCGVVHDAETNERLNEIKVEIFSIDGSQSLFAGNVTTNGFFKTNLKAGNYSTYITGLGYLPYSEKITFVKDTVYIPLQKVKQGTKVVLNNLFFASGKTTILPESEQALEDLYTFLVENTNVKIKIVGHTDNIGNDIANQKLSEGRAQSVRDNMVQRGIDSSRITYEGKGESDPVSTNDTVEGRAANRRVEFTIL